ncbi:MAG: TIGR02265 family protein [Acidobacteria bacterium]|nr:TIGR02265 family protein [Acidobacteriota bacterium]
MKVKGNIIKARQVFVEERYGEKAWKDVLATLPADDQKLFGGMILNITWFDLKAAMRLDESIVRVLGRGDNRVFEEMGRASARENLGGVHNNLVTPGDPQAFMKKAQLIYSFYYDVGHRTYEPTGLNSGTMTTHGAETFSATDCSTVVGWYKEALGMCGATGVQIKEVKCRARGDSVCQYEVEWS